MHNNNAVFIEKPRMLGVRGWSLLVPAFLAAIGFCSFAVLAFSFTELQSLPSAFRRGLVIVGSFSLAIGGEMGTLAATVEIFRKRRTAEAWDWIALFISALATVAAFILSFAALLGVNATWSTAVKLYGPIVLGVLAAFDAYSGFAEVGMYLSTYDTRLAEWERLQTERARFGYVAPVETAEDVQRAEVRAALTEAQTALLRFYRADPHAKAEDAGVAVDRSRQWVSKQLTTLEAAGVIHRNGNGVEVL